MSSASDPCSPAAHGDAHSARCHGLGTAARVRAWAADLLCKLRQQLLTGRRAAVTAWQMPRGAVLAGQGLVSPLLMVVPQLTRPQPGRCGRTYTWQPRVGGRGGHGCGRQSTPGWSQVVGPRSFNAPSSRLRGAGRPAGWASQSEELCGPCFCFTLETTQPCTLAIDS